MKFNLDDAMLVGSSVGTAAYGLHCLAAPKSFSDLHKAKGQPQSDPWVSPAGPGGLRASGIETGPTVVHAPPCARGCPRGPIRA